MKMRLARRGSFAERGYFPLFGSTQNVLSWNIFCHNVFFFTGGAINYGGN